MKHHDRNATLLQEKGNIQAARYDQNTHKPESKSYTDDNSIEDRTSGTLLLAGRVVEVLGDLQDQLDVLLVQSFATPQSKQLSSLEHIFDLTSVESKSARQIVQIGLADLVRERALEVLLS